MKLPTIRALVHALTKPSGDTIRVDASPEHALSQALSLVPHH